MIDFLNDVINSYASFFSLETIKLVISDPANWGVVGSLIILEGLLSADNALVLAVMVKHLPQKKQRKALFYGILGAFLFRFLAIGLGVFLIKITWLKIVGGFYLLGLSAQYIINKNQEEDEGKAKNKYFGFWRTVLAVELMDITFSIDSVIAAFGVSDRVWVLFIGGMLGVIMMRGVAQLFLVLIEKVPEFETTAFILIAIIGLKMIGAAFGFYVEELVFFSILIAIFLGTFVVHLFRKIARKPRAR